MPGTRKKRRNLERQDWIEAARQRLVATGVISVKIETLATALGTTRGSFYWHFADHAELLDELLKLWVECNTGPFRCVLGSDENLPLNQALRYLMIWINGEFDPAYDAAVRDWARTSATVAESVRQIDDERLDILFDIFERLGYEPTEALVRARICYYHQVGYYALKVVQSREERLKLLPAYFRSLIGSPLPPHLIEKEMPS